MSNNPYVFISYAHMNSDMVLPCVNAMKQNGINLWFDEGIEAGSEWPEFIAEKVVSCAKFVLFVSKDYLNSQNCKRELNFAISRKKDILTIYLESVELSPGMEMQLGTYQAIYRNRFANAETFHESLCRETYFNSCRSFSAQNDPYSAQSQTDTAANINNGQTAFTPPPTQPDPAKTTTVPALNKTLAALLAIFLGSIGIHKFYLKQTKRGILYLLLCWTYVTAIIAFIEGIAILVMSNEKFEKKYKCRVQR